MNTSDLKYRFQKTRHKSGKFLSSNGFAASALLLVSGIFGTQLIVTSDLDEQTTENTPKVLEEFQQQLERLTSQKPQDQSNYIRDLLLAEDLSEEQAGTLLKDFRDHVGNVQEATGYDIGNPGDLRECRAESTTEKAQDIAACTIDKSSDEKILNQVGGGIWALMFVLYVLGGGQRHFQRWARTKPKNPQFKH